MLAAVLVASLAVLLAACGSPSAPSSPIAHPVAVLRGLPAAVSHSGSVHFVEVTTAHGFKSTLTGDLSASSTGDAEERLVQGTTELDLEKVHGDLFLRASAEVLQSKLKVSPQAAKAYAGKWVELTPGDYLFPQLSPTLDLAAEIDAFIPAGDVSAGAGRTLQHMDVVPITGTPSSTVAQGSTGVLTLFVTPAAPHLPAAASLVLHKGARTENRIVAFAHWGAPIELTAPAEATPYRIVATS